MCLSCVSLKLAVTHTSSSGTTVRSCCPGCTFSPTTTVLFTSPVTGATILVYCRFSSACSSSARFCSTSAIAARTRARVEETCCGPVSADWWFASACAGRLWACLHKLLRGGFIGVGCRHRRGTGFSRSQCLIVDLLGHFLFVHQQLIALQIGLHPHIVGLGLFQLGMGGGELPLGGNHSRLGVLDVGCRRLQLARSVDRSNRDRDIERLRRGFSTGQIGLRPARPQLHSLSDRSPPAQCLAAPTGCRPR